MKLVISLIGCLSAAIFFLISSVSASVSGQSPPLEKSVGVFQIAGVYWLPDYLKDNIDNNRRSEISPDNPDIEGECGTYGLIAACSPPKTPESKKRPLSNLICYERCICSDSYHFNSSNCNSAGYQLGGGSCEGLYISCTAKSCPAASATSCSSVQISSPNGSYSGGSPCYTCRDQTCADGGFVSSVPANQVCSTTQYAGNTCYKGCRNKDDNCASGLTKTSCGSSQVQTNTTTTEAGSTCYACREKDNSCSSGYSSSVCSNSQVQTGTKDTEAGTTCYACRAKDNNCTSGYSKSACNGSQVQTGFKYTEAGSACYSCRAKTCAEQDMKDCKGSCIETSACCDGCSRGYTCKNGNCEKNVCIPQTCADFPYLHYDTKSPTYRSPVYRPSDGCGNYVECYKWDAPCYEVCKTEECISYCEMYPWDECWWPGCRNPYTGL